jgi:hypothetical protein
VADRKVVETQSEHEKREALGNAGRKILKHILETLFARIRTEAQMARMVTEFGVALGNARLEADIASRTPGLHFTGFHPADAFSHSKWNVVISETMSLFQWNPDYEWSASL